MNDRHKILLSISLKLNNRLNEEKQATSIDKQEIVRMALREYLSVTDDDLIIDRRIKTTQSKVKAGSIKQEV